MITRFRTLQADDSIASVVAESSSGHQKNFPVLDGQEPARRPPA